MGRFQIGHIFGIPIVLDGSFLLLALLFGFHHFISADLAAVSFGIVLVAGVALSILLHELGHATAARLFGVPTAYIELNGLGGLCHFARSITLDRLRHVVVLLAGPFANLILWQAFGAGGHLLLMQPSETLGSVDRMATLLLQLSQLNLLLMVFNLLPSHPLDGGRVIMHLSSALIGYDRAARLVAVLGLMIAAWLVWLGFSGQYFAFLIAFVLFQTNAQALQVHGGGPRWRRWD